MFRNLCSSLNIEHKTSSSCHQQTNGKVEKFNQYLKNSLATVVRASIQDWNEMFENVLFFYESSNSRVLEDSPFNLLYALDPVFAQDVQDGILYHVRNDGQQLLIIPHNLSEFLLNQYHNHELS